MPNVNIPPINMESWYKEIIADSLDLQSWNRYFNDLQERGESLMKHLMHGLNGKNILQTHFKINPQDHPKYIKNKLLN